MSFFTILGAASGDLFTGMMVDRLLEPSKPAESAKPATATTEAAKPATVPATPQPAKASQQPLKSYRTSMGDRAYY